MSDFTQVMSERSDKQLVDILTVNRADYVEEAIAAAEKELEKRRLDVNNFYTPSDVDAIIETRNRSRESMRFEWYHKVLTFISPILLGFVCLFIISRIEILNSIKYSSWILVIACLYFLHDYLKKQGYTRMAEDFKKWLVYTLYIYIAIIVVLIIITVVLGYSGLL